MRKRTILGAGIGAMLLLVPATHAAAGVIHKRERRQEARIERGVHSGRVTPREAQRLEGEQQTIHDERARALADGRVTRGERREIRHDQRAASRDIYRKKHNARGN